MQCIVIFRAVKKKLVEDFLVFSYFRSKLLVIDKYLIQFDAHLKINNNLCFRANPDST